MDESWILLLFVGVIIVFLIEWYLIGPWIAARTPAASGPVGMFVKAFLYGVLFMIYLIVTCQTK